MIKFSRIWCVIAMAILQWVATAARAEQWFFFSPVSGEIELGLDSSWNTNENASDSETHEFEQRLRLRQAGYILDPRIASFNFGIEPTFRQRRFTDDFGTTRSNDDTLNYDINLRAFQGTPGPLGFTGSARRNTGNSDDNFGGRSDFDIQTGTGAVNWKNRAFPMSLTYDEQITDSIARSADGTITSERDDTRRTLRLEGRSRKLQILASHEDFEDRIREDTTTDRARVIHNLRWGRNSSLNSNINYTDREGGTNPYESFSINENLALQHIDNLSSTTTYNFDTTTQTNETVQHRGTFRLRHELYNNLITTANVLGSRRTTEQVSEENEYGGGLDFAYRKRIPWEGTVTAGLGGSYIVTDRKTVNGVLSIVDEPHFVEITTVSFLLDERFIIESSIVITDSGTGIPFVPGADYLVVPVANNLTEIQIVPGGAISNAAPITVLASYDFQPLPTQELSTTTLNYNLGADFRWVRLYHRDRMSDQERISGAPVTFLTDTRDMTTGIEFNWTGGRSRASLVGERRYQEIGVRKTETYSIRQFLNWIAASNMSLTASASQDFIETEDESDSTVYTANASMLWRPRYYVTVRPFLTGFVRTDEGAAVINGSSEQYFMSAGIASDWRYGKIDVQLRYSYENSGGDTTDRTRNRVELNLTRKF